MMCRGAFQVTDVTDGNLVGVALNSPAVHAMNLCLRQQVGQDVAVAVGADMYVRDNRGIGRTGFPQQLVDVPFPGMAVHAVHPHDERIAQVEQGNGSGSQGGDFHELHIEVQRDKHHGNSQGGHQETVDLEVVTAADIESPPIIPPGTWLPVRSRCRVHVHSRRRGIHRMCQETKGGSRTNSRESIRGDLATWPGMFRQDVDEPVLFSS